MKSIHFIFCLCVTCLVVSFSSKAFATRPKNTKVLRTANEKISFIENKLIRLRFGLWGPYFRQGRGKKIRLNLFSAGKMQRMLFEDRLANEYFKQYRMFQVVGFVLTLGGVGAMLGGLMWLVLSPSSIFSGSSTASLVGFSITSLVGIVLSFLGPLVMLIGNERLMKAIDTFNQGVFSRARRGHLRIGFHFSPKGGATACVGITF